MATPTPAPSYTSAGGSNNPPPPPPLSLAGGPPQQGPSVLQILAMGQERNYAADAMAHHPRIESLIKLGKEAEATWLQIGQTAEAVSDPDRAIAAYESALRHNAYSVVALSQIAAIYRSREEFKMAAEYFGRVVSIAPESGDVWGALGHCFLMIDDLKKAYSSYQQALYYMPNPHEPKLWYGIGILYDRYGSLEHAEEAFSSVIRMEPKFEKANEIFFRLGIIYKQQRKSAQSLECFRYILNNPPRPLTEIDIWFQIGHVYEQQQDFIAAKESYERVLQENPAHAKVLQQLGGLYHRSHAPFYDPEMSVQILTRSLESDPNDPFSWYLLGRAYMTTSNFGKAYEAYQQAVYRDGKNPAFWCSIGVLYYNINQFHDALDAYSRAIRIHPYLAEVWFNLGALYEACNDQMTDAIDAYQRTLQLDPANTIVMQRLNEIRDHQNSGAPLSPPPAPKDISPSSMSWSYATNSGGAPAQLAQAGLGPDLSPSMGPPAPPAANGAPSRVPTAGSGASPHAPPARYDATAVNGSRPRSTDPYRRSAIQHSPSSFSGGPAGAASRYAGPSAPGHRLPPYKDARTASNGRLGSPPSPRSRPSEGPAGQSGGYPFPSHLINGNREQAREPAAGPDGGAEWDRSRAGYRNGSTNAPPPRAALQPPTLGQPHPYSHAHPPSHQPAQPSPYPYPHASRSPHMHPAAPHGVNGAPFERTTAAPAAGVPRPPFFDNPSPGPYGAYPPAGAGMSAAAEEFARRRSSGSTNGSHRSALTETKPTVAGPEGSAAAPSTAAPAPAAAPTKGRGGRKKAENGPDGPKKGGRRSKAAAAADSVEGSAASTGSATTPKKRRAKAAPKAQKEQAAAREKENEEAAQAAGTLAGRSPPQTQAPPPPSAAAEVPIPVREEPVAQREVDEEYDEGVDALMSLGAAARGEMSPPSAVRTSMPAPPPPPAAAEHTEHAALDTSQSRKRSLPVESAAGEASDAAEPDAKRARPDPAVPQPDAESVQPAAATEQDAGDHALGPAPTEKANMSGEATEEMRARKHSDPAPTPAASASEATEAQQSNAAPEREQQQQTRVSPEEDKENDGESVSPDKDKLPRPAATETEEGEIAPTASSTDAAGVAAEAPLREA